MFMMSPSSTIWCCHLGTILGLSLVVGSLFSINGQFQDSSNNSYTIQTDFFYRKTNFPKGTNKSYPITSVDKNSTPHHHAIETARDGELFALRQYLTGQIYSTIKARRETSNNSVGGDSRVEATQVLRQQSHRIHATAIYVDKAEFPLTRLLFKLTLRLALEEASAKLLERHQIKLSMSIRSANTCSRQFASAIAAEEYYTKRARLFIISGCDEAIRGVSRLASSWKIPIMTAAGFSADLNDKTIYQTLVRVAFSLKAAVEFLFKIMKSFQWRRINLIVDESDPNSLALKGSIEKHSMDYETSNFRISLNVIQLDLQTLASLQSPISAETNDLDTTISTNSSNRSNSTYMPPKTSINPDDRWPNEATEKTIQAALKQSSLFSRVSVLLIPQQYLRKFMLSVYDQNMANGLYTFVNIPLLLAASDDQVIDSQQTFLRTTPADGPSKATIKAKQTSYLLDVGLTKQKQSSYLSATGENVFVWRSMRSTRNSHAKQAFESLMSIYLKTPSSKEHVYFSNKLTNLANSEYGTTTTTEVSVNRELGSDGQSIIYAKTLNELLDIERVGANTTKPGIGIHAKVSESMKGKRFDNMLTGTVRFNMNGDREVDFTLDDMSQLTGKFNPVILYRAETREIERLGRIHWSSDPLVGPTSDTVDCMLIGTCASKPRTRLIVAILLMAIPLTLVFGGLFFFVQNKISLESKLVDHWWRIHMSEIELISTRRKQNNDGTLIMSSGVTGGSLVSSSQQMQSTIMAANGSSRLSGKPVVDIAAPGGTSIVEGGDGARTTVTRATHTTTMVSSLDVCYGNILLGMYKLSRVALRPICRFHQSRKMMIELRTIKDINHQNLCRFIGIVVDEGNTAIVSEFCPKGSLREFFYNESMVIDWTFKYSIINDIVAGLHYLHSSQLGFHGRLKSSNCLVSARFVIKLSDYGPHSLFEQLDADIQDESVKFKKRIWLAPEHMKSNSKVGSPKGDIYSLGLLLYEIITNKLPFFDPEANDYIMPLKSLYKELKANGPNERVGPDLSAIDPGPGVNIQPLVELMESCWQFESSKRPSLLVVETAIKKITKGITSKKLLDNLTTRMEQYTNNLESLVEEKLAALVEEKLKTEELLYQFVPKSIAPALKEGQTIEPEAFDCVTVFYSDIVGFTSLSSESSPMEVVDLLSDLYLCFDETLEQHDIFKVDTIGDAYIVASGLPIRNDGKHVVEIACAALELRDRLAKFRIPHKPGRALEMRVGIHSGPCIAGIVGGLNMPKYCVFGDTLTIGKFMESTGLPMKIHITEESRRLLDGVQEFTIEPRQPRVVKDGLPFQTYWLERHQV